MLRSIDAFHWKQGIRWPVSRGHIAGSSLQLIEITCFFAADRWPIAGFPVGSRAHVRLTCWKQGSIVLKPDKSFKFNRIITFFYKNVFCFFLLCMQWLLKLKTEVQTIYRKPQSYKTQIKLLPFPKQHGPGATLLGWPKSIYYQLLQPVYLAVQACIIIVRIYRPY